MKKRVNDTDAWTFFLPASGKYKENDYVAHHKALDHIYEYYKEKLGSTKLDRIWLFTDGCPTQYACRQNYVRVAQFPSTHDGTHLVHVIAP